MAPHSGASISAWATTSQLPHAQALSDNMEVDVCIIGGGIAGLTTAYLLSQQNKSIAVLEMGTLGGGDTARTTAHLASAIDDRFFNLEKWLGEDGARQAAASHQAAIDKIESIVAAENIDCDFKRVNGYLFAVAAQGPHILDDELAAAKRAGLDVEKIDRAPLDSFNTGPALKFARQAQFHPLKYLAKLIDKITLNGGRVFTHTQAKEIERGKPLKIQTSVGKVITAQSVVIATNSPIADHYVMMTKLFPYRSYAVGALIPRGSVTEALFWDTEEPYHYVRTQPYSHNGEQIDLLIIGGEDHKTGQADDAEQRYSKLEMWGRQRFPSMKDIAFRWSGQILETLDGLAYIGPNPSDDPNVYIATGDSGHGMTHGTLAGMILSDLILEKPNSFAALYDPKRKTIRAAGHYLAENTNVAVQYAKWVTGGEVKSADEIPPGEGAIIRRGLKKLAVFKGEDGTVSECSAICPHMDCVVAWNSGEKSWDCPCHGSRFDPNGKVITGPAFSDLSPVEHKPEEIHAEWKK